MIQFHLLKGVIAENVNGVIEVYEDIFMLMNMGLSLWVRILKIFLCKKVTLGIEDKQGFAW